MRQEKRITELRPPVGHCTDAVRFGVDRPAITPVVSNRPVHPDMPIENEGIAGLPGG